MNKKKPNEMQDVDVQLIPVTEVKFDSSLEKLSLPQLFELLKIIIEIEESELEVLRQCPHENPKRLLH